MYRENFGIMLPVVIIYGISGLHNFAYSHKQEELKNTHFVNLEVSELSPTCAGHIDSINGAYPASSEVMVTNTLTMNGWLIADVANEHVPEEVYISFTSESGKNFYVKTRKTKRQDVKEHFKKTDMSDLGFEINADISSLYGKYADAKYLMEFIYLYKGDYRKCSNIILNLTVTQ